MAKNKKPKFLEKETPDLLALLRRLWLVRRPTPRRP